jgi:hypothetical protein
MNLTIEERQALESMAHAYTSPCWRCDLSQNDSPRRAVGLFNDVIAGRLNTPRQVISKWRKRFALADRLAFAPKYR